MIDHQGALLLIRNKLLTIGAARLPDPASRIAWDGVDFDVPDPSPAEDGTPTVWLRETYIPGREPQVGFEMLELTAVVQYDVFTPAGGGGDDARNLAKLIGDALSPGRPGLSGTGPSGQPVNVSIVRAEMAKGGVTQVNGQSWYCQPVRILFRSYAPNANA